jgi:hypothetical protein
MSSGLDERANSIGVLKHVGRLAAAAAFHNFNNNSRIPGNIFAWIFYNGFNPQADRAARIVVDNLQRFALIKNLLGKTRNRKTPGDKTIAATIIRSGYFVLMSVSSNPSHINAHMGTGVKSIFDIAAKGKPRLRRFVSFPA